MGLTTFLPMYVQGILHQSPVEAGLALTMLMVGWPCGSILASRGFAHFRFAATHGRGQHTCSGRCSRFRFLTAGSSPVHAGMGSMVMGLGMGFVNVTSLVLIQEIVDWSQRGSVTASNLFLAQSRQHARRSRLRRRTQFQPPSWERRRRGDIGSTATDSRGPSGTEGGQAIVRLALEQSLHITFWAMFAVSLAHRAYDPVGAFGDSQSTTRGASRATALAA